MAAAQQKFQRPARRVEGREREGGREGESKYLYPWGGGTQ